MGGCMQDHLIQGESDVREPIVEEQESFYQGILRIFYYNKHADSVYFQKYWQQQDDFECECLTGASKAQTEQMELETALCASPKSDLKTSLASQAVSEPAAVFPQIEADMSSKKVTSSMFILF